MQKFLQSGWAAQSFKTKKRSPSGYEATSGCEAKKLSQPIKN
ncbi:MAG: hypothetical protein SPE49_05670 [Campylobacter sp.]|nr:hypothetical protein [Campylobacter sp.]MDY5115438.1 hypothetical protein [Campylobacter sp.]